MPINMNGNINDTNYRYTMEEPKLTVAGKGNGIYTIFNNINNVCKSFNHPSNIVMTYIASITGSSYISERDTITGIHKYENIVDYLIEYIKFLVMCPKCNIPETIPRIEGTKKNTTLILCCSACKNESVIKPINKRIDKGTDIIIKYLKSGNNWLTNKGTMVEQQIKNNDDIFNPF